MTSDTPDYHAHDSTAIDILESFGRYRKIKLLGRGGMGAVFLVHDSQLDRQVALKVPAYGPDIPPGEKERFLREARAISRLRHPNLCPIYDAGEQEGLLFYTMSYIEGLTLAERTARKPFETQQAVKLIRTVALAMHEAHRLGTVHRDLKPANILIDAAGEPVVTDFGLAFQIGWQSESSNSPHTLTHHGEILGTPAYMSPEQACGDQSAVGIASDIYSLGVILFELIASRRPFDADNFLDLRSMILHDPAPKPSEFYPWLPPALDVICRRALEKDPKWRFATMAEFERELNFDLHEQHP